MIFFISVLINADDLYLGGIAQLVEHLLCKQGVSGSNPLTSTSMGLQLSWLEHAPDKREVGSSSLLKPTSRFFCTVH